MNNNKGPLAILGEEKRAHEERLAKMQEDMQRVFEQKVAEKERRLRVKEDEMMRKHEEMRQNLEAQQVNSNTDILCGNNVSVGENRYVIFRGLAGWNLFI